MRKPRVSYLFKILEQVAELESKLLSPHSQPLFCANPCSKMVASLERSNVPKRYTKEGGHDRPAIIALS